MRSDLAVLESYGYRDLIDKAAHDFFGGEIQDAYTLAASQPGEGATGIDQFGDNAGAVLPVTAMSLAEGRNRLQQAGAVEVNQGALETGAGLAGQTAMGRASGDGGSAYAELVGASLEAAGYNPVGVTPQEIAAQAGISVEQAQAALGGTGDPSLIDAVIQAHSQLLEDRNKAISGTVQAGYV